MEEIWKTVVYQGDVFDNFEVSNLGRIRNVSTGNVLKQFINKLGYYQVCVSLGGRNNKKIFKTHKAVAETFISNSENKLVVNHIDGNKLNNNVDNLEWVTYSENSQHAWDNGLINSDGTKVLRKLSNKQVEYIRNNYIPGDKEFGCRALSRKFNMHHKTIESLLKCDTYVDVV